MDEYIDYNKDNYLSDYSKHVLKDRYMRADEASAQQRFKYIAEVFSSNPSHARRMYEYASNLWLSFSTPILSFDKDKKNLPISCFLNYVEDTAEGLVYNLSETNWFSIYGGGVGIYFATRPADDKSTGVMPHLKMYDAGTIAYKQGRTRRGSYAAYLDIDHPDINMFIDLRKPTGDQNFRCLNIHHGINISDKFMKIIENCILDKDYDDSWDLIAPHNKKVVETVSAKKLWEKILETRITTGEPYLHFVDASNRAMPNHLKKLGRKIHQSNLCSEITLPTDKDRSAVCCLSSLNIEMYDDWKDNKLFYKDVAEFLDNVLSYFIKNAPDNIARARMSAKMERSIGIGALGFHYYLQKHKIPFESAMAVGINKEIFKRIRSNLDICNLELGKERGSSYDLKGTGKRFSHLMAIAPNATSSTILNTSPSVEPVRANAYRHDTVAGYNLIKNKFLDEIILSESDKHQMGWYEETWSSIISNSGSVQHLNWMTPEIKNVYKTALEIDQRWIIQHASDRQKYIDQAQSINLFLSPNVKIEYLHLVHFIAWKNGLKTLYYCRSEKMAQGDKLFKSIEREALNSVNIENLIGGDMCLACEG